ncbi:hypothetical protein BDV28DRAFT_132576 [Aspergillus coremiiformis]|uniref:Uncharacterized protein n=1 Tax=Aspergillus coremiiformis TaxID=138285 RepID=A0A5N6Z7S4_9EURO|nr:hypothetical protein BDV28DRAFT_132576 [Aspergillus coremiiformis]
MADTTGVKNSLHDIVREGKFIEIPDDTALDLFKEAFGTELSHLRDASPTVESGASKPLQGSPSQRVFRRDFHEVNRTLTSMLAIKWVLAGDYATFTGGQKDNKLEVGSFEKLQTFCRDRLPTPEEIYALIVAMAIDDIGKDKALAKDLGMVEKNHAEVLLEAVRREKVPALETVTEQNKKDIIQSLEIGSKLDISQMVQGETVPRSLLVLNDGRRLEKAFNIKAMVTFLDVGGAAAHCNPRGCVVMTQPVFRHYMKAIELLDSYRQEESPDWTECYGKYLAYRHAILEGAGLVSLSAETLEGRALLRLLCMGRVETKARADQFLSAFTSLVPDTKQKLVNGLSVMGIGDGKAILPYYAPGILSEMLRGVPEDRIMEFLRVFMRFLVKVYDGSQPDRTKPDDLEERDLAGFQELVKTADFKRDPEILVRELDK